MSEPKAGNDEFLADLEEAMRDVVDPELGINAVSYTHLTLPTKA